MRLLRNRASLHYIKNPESRKTDLIDKHGIYPMIEVKSCTSKRIAMDEETGHPSYIIIQRYKDSTLAQQDSGPWDTVKTDKNAFFVKFFETQTYNGFFAFKAADLAAYCDAAILNKDFDDYYDKDHNIGNVKPDSYKLAHRHYLPKILKSIDHWVGFDNFTKAVFESESANLRDLYTAYVELDLKSGGSQRQPRQRSREKPDPSRRSQPLVQRPPTPPLELA